MLGHYQKAPSEEIRITQEDIFGVNVGEPWAPEDVEEEVLKGNGKGFYHFSRGYRSSRAH